MQPMAFLSHTRKDDEFFGGYITEFRKTLENAVHVVSGDESFKIFQDIEGIVIGENWKRKLTEVIQQSSFLVPMLSPLFLNSAPCREEVTEFLHHERALDRDDLILPVYFLLTAKLEKEEERARDPIAKELAARQMFDWRETAMLPLKDPVARLAVLELARGIAAATDRLGIRGEREPRTGLETNAHFADARIDTGVAGDSRRTEPSPAKILWVDDEPDNNRWERQALESYGLRFTLARDTETAKSLLIQDGGFAAVISDMGRPGDSRAGITLLEWLRQGPYAATPYFIYTSRRVASRKPSVGAEVPSGITADPDELVEMVVSAVR